jgi:hypothetical protein
MGAGGCHADRCCAREFGRRRAMRRKVGASGPFHVKRSAMRSLAYGSWCSLRRAPATDACTGPRGCRAGRCSRETGPSEGAKVWASRPVGVGESRLRLVSLAPPCAGFGRLERCAWMSRRALLPRDRAERRGQGLGFSTVSRETVGGGEFRPRLVSLAPPCARVDAWTVARGRRRPPLRPGTMDRGLKMAQRPRASATVSRETLGGARASSARPARLVVCRRESLGPCA